MDPPQRRSLHSTCHTSQGAAWQRITVNHITCKCKAQSLTSIATPPSESVEDQLLSPSPKPTASQSSTHFPSLHCLHVGETHALVAGLLTYSSLAPPTRRDYTKRERQRKAQEVECKQEVIQVKKEGIKMGVECSDRMTKSTNQMPPRLFHLPLPQTSSMQSVLPCPLYTQSAPKSIQSEKLNSIKGHTHWASFWREQGEGKRQDVMEEEQEVKMEEVKKIKKKK